MWRKLFSVSNFYFEHDDSIDFQNKYIDECAQKYIYNTRKFSEVFSHSKKENFILILKHSIGEIARLSESISKQFNIDFREAKQLLIKRLAEVKSSDLKIN